MQFAESVNIVQLLFSGIVMIAVKIAMASLLVDDGKKNVDPLKLILGEEGEVWVQPYPLRQSVVPIDFTAPSV
jgi:hypothetical protein